MYVWEIEDLNKIINRPLVIANVSEDEKKIIGIRILDEPANSEIVKKLLEIDDKTQLAIFRKEYELFQKSVRINRIEVENMMNDISIYFTESVQKFLDDIRNQLLEISNQVLPCEKGIELFSRVYLKIVESVFSRMMAINCFMIRTISKGYSKKITEYLNMGIAHMESIQLFDGSNKCLLLGYNRIIRNSIAHSKIDTRQFGKKIVFIDEYKDKKKTAILEHKEFRKLVYLLYRNAIMQIAANKYFWEKTLNNDPITYLPVLDIETYLACIRDELYSQSDEIRNVLVQDGYKDMIEFYIFKIEYDNVSSLIISIRINSHCEYLLQLFLKQITYSIARICRYLEKSIYFKLTDIKSNVFDLDDLLIMVGGCTLADIESPIKIKSKRMKQ